MRMAWWSKIASAFCLLFANSGAVGSEVSSLPTVTIHDHGQSLRISFAQPAAREIGAECERQLATATDILKLIVTKSLIRDLRHETLSVEIEYRQIQEFQLIINKLENKIEMLQALLQSRENPKKVKF